MKKLRIALVLLSAVVLTSACSYYSGSARSSKPDQGKQASAQAAMTIGGANVVTLTRPAPTDHSKPQFLQAIILPGRGMNLLQVKAYLPGKGEVNLINAPGLEETKQFLDGQDDEFGNNNFKIGAAVLLPWANRIRGKVSPDGKTIETTVGGKTVLLPAGWSGKKPGAERHAIHGLMLRAKFGDVLQRNGPTESSVTGLLHAGNFDGHWPSQTDVDVQTVLKDDALEMTVTAKNVGQKPLPMGIGFHPYFMLPSGDRKQARLHLPSDTRAAVNNYDDVFPTGKLLTVKSTPYDFTARGGRELGDLFMDDNFVHLKRNADGTTVVEIIDPAANYGLRMTSLSPEVTAIQVYAPTDKNFIAVEPQFNGNDPFNKIWGKQDTGMVLLQPGQSVSWRVRLELFTPGANAH
jgi:aldose 1-epimerase